MANLTLSNTTEDRSWFPFHLVLDLKSGTQALTLACYPSGRYTRNKKGSGAIGRPSTCDYRLRKPTPSHTVFIHAKTCRTMAGAVR